MTRVVCIHGISSLPDLRKQHIQDPHFYFARKQLKPKAEFMSHPFCYWSTFRVKPATSINHCYLKCKRSVLMICHCKSYTGRFLILAFFFFLSTLESYINARIQKIAVSVKHSHIGNTRIKSPWMPLTHSIMSIYCSMIFNHMSTHF